jgi:hypothetical protein
MGRLTVVLILLANILTIAVASPPIVDLGYAKYQGYLDSTTNNTHFLSIRYAEPPLGIERLPDDHETYLNSTLRTSPILRAVISSSYGRHPTSKCSTTIMSPVVFWSSSHIALPRSIEKTDSQRPFFRGLPVP